MQSLSNKLRLTVMFFSWLSLPLLVSADEFSDGITLGGYGSAIFDVHPGGAKDASLSEVSMFLGWEGDSRWRFFSELELDKPISWQSGQALSVTDSKLNLERIYLDYNVSETVNLRAGRFYNPVGRWNLIHADPLEWTTTRPLATTRLFPQSTNGVMLFGSKSINSEAVEYSLYFEALENDRKERNLGEAQDTRGLHVQLTGDDVIGFSLLEFNEHLPIDAQYRVLGLDYLTRFNDCELSLEAFQRFRTNQDNGGSGGYVQFVAPIVNRWYAVARVDTTEVPQEDSTTRWLIGATYKITPKQVFKLEYSGGTRETPDSPKGLISSFSILF
jgi:hypothetical protein